MAQSDIAQRLVLIEESLARIEALLRAVVPPSEEREHIAEATEHVADSTETDERQDAQLAALAASLLGRAADDDMQDALFQTQQIVSVMQGTRTDIVQMRATLLRLAALLEQTLHVRVEDEERGIVWRTGDADRRKTG